MDLFINTKKPEIRNAPDKLYNLLITDFKSIINDSIDLNEGRKLTKNQELVHNKYQFQRKKMFHHLSEKAMKGSKANYKFEIIVILGQIIRLNQTYISLNFQNIIK